MLLQASADKRHAAAEIVLEDATLDVGQGEPIADGQRWSLGQFKNVAIINGKSYVVAGGNWREVIGRKWFPVRLVEVEGRDRQRLICELLPKYMPELK